MSKESSNTRSRVFLYAGMMLISVISVTQPLLSLINFAVLLGLFINDIQKYNKQREQEDIQDYIQKHQDTRKHHEAPRTPLQ